ncbi:MAG: hypothetical protein NEA02_15535 [Thermoanaerobaculia bacterium]|nr:hypothetical protein [Thermoanaerobaculia bacterium]
MKIRRPLLKSALSVALLVAVVPMLADTYGFTPAGDTFKVNVKFERAFLVDGGARFEPGVYEVSLRSLGDGTVRATFTRNGKIGFATGKAQWGDRAQGAPGIGGNVSEQIGANKASGGTGNQPNTFARYGFTAQSAASFQQVGTQWRLVLKGYGNNQIQVGLTAAPSK